MLTRVLINSYISCFEARLVYHIRWTTKTSSLLGQEIFPIFSDRVWHFDEESFIIWITERMEFIRQLRIHCWSIQKGCSCVQLLTRRFWSAERDVSFDFDACPISISEYLVVLRNRYSKAFTWQTTGFGTVNIWLGTKGGIVVYKLTINHNHVR